MSDPQNTQRLSAAHFLSKKEYGKAIQCYLTLLTNINYPITHFETDLVYAIGIYGNSLTDLGHIPKAEWLWEKIIEMAGDRSKLLLYCYARFLSSPSIRKLRSALIILEKCLKIDPSYCAAIETSENIKGLIVDRWHFRMLNDKHRNVTYLHAIQNAIGGKRRLIMLCLIQLLVI